jgi:hypothetical protein
MREAGKMGAILLAVESFDMLPLFAIVYLKGFIVPRCEKEFTSVIKVERGS